MNKPQKPELSLLLAEYSKTKSKEINYLSKFPNNNHETIDEKILGVSRFQKFINSLSIIKIVILSVITTLIVLVFINFQLPVDETILSLGEYYSDQELNQNLYDYDFTASKLIQESFKPDNLVNYSDGEIELETETALMLEELINQAKSQGIYIKLLKGYKSYDTVSLEYNQYREKLKLNGVNSNIASNLINRVISPPLRSEYRLGTSVDLVCESCNDYDLNESNIKVWTYLQNVAQDYGFINIQNSSINRNEYWHYIYRGL